MASKPIIDGKAAHAMHLPEALHGGGTLMLNESAAFKTCSPKPPRLTKSAREA